VPARLGMRMPHLRFEFSFSLKPIIQVMARLPATFNIDFICSNSDFLVAGRIRYTGVLTASLCWAEVAWDSKF